MGPGYPNGLVTAEPSTVHPSARPVRDDVAETATPMGSSSTSSLLTKYYYHLAANVLLRINLDPRYLSCVYTRNFGPSIVPS